MTIHHKTDTLARAMDWTQTVPIPGRTDLVANCRRILAYLVTVSETDPAHTRYRIANVTQAGVIRKVIPSSRSAGYRAIRRLKRAGLIKVFGDSDSAIRVNWP